MQRRGENGKQKDIIAALSFKMIFFIFLKFDFEFKRETGLCYKAPFSRKTQSYCNLFSLSTINLSPFSNIQMHTNLSDKMTDSAKGCSF